MLHRPTTALLILSPLTLAAVLCCTRSLSQKKLGVTWDVPLYGELLKIGGGKERMTHYFNQVGWPQAAPTDPSERAAFVAGLHKSKTALFMQLVETGALPLRPGVARWVSWRWVLCPCDQVWHGESVWL
ncbi:unnamed protein product [Closterium sp. NIES-53]